ncbi:uncharacterized protein LOC125749626 isoform X1 [Brienomyrus brachyistius]|uniref:uncharacterized protein LOC125749626 isoform X1 n=1 Tax=Brienomyrus brachyistius TaxID=42636 RepID=UPI0020B2DB0D|nr:uncharacterized protein LOC125749626 isoform X1 [Brienomyrus brachyistius]
MATGIKHMSTPMSTGDISSPDKMSTDNGELVWVGFIDVLPVIGSVKEAVEFVLAVAGGDHPLINEKERMMKARLGLEEKTDSQSSTESSSGYCSGEERADVHAEEVLLSDLPGVIEAGKHGKGKQSGKESQEPPSEEDQKKMEAIREETLQKIQLIDQNYQFQEPLIDTRKRSQRGEHVINNNVIKFHFKLVEDYLTSRSSQTSLDVSCPLPENTKRDIMCKMVAHFETSELYINANAVVYGKYMSELKNALLQFLQDGGQESKNRASFVIQRMNQCSAYVDFMAKEKWMQNSCMKRCWFEAVRREVAEMFADKRGVEFFAELRKDILSPTDNV